MQHEINSRILGVSEPMVALGRALQDRIVSAMEVDGAADRPGIVTIAMQGDGQ